MKSFYKEHCINLKMIEKAIKSVKRILRDYISKNDDVNIYIFTKILSHLINTWAEVRVLKLVYETKAFTVTEKEKLLKKKLKERWEEALKIAFCKAYKISNQNKIEDADITPRMRFKELKKIINEDLLNSNEIRNKIAHGQWKYAFNNDLLDINKKLTGELHKENIIKLQLKLKMFKSLAQIIHDLAVSKPTFERDFDVNYRKIEEQIRNFHKKNYEKYKKIMIEKKQRGIIKRNLFNKLLI